MKSELKILVIIIFIIMSTFIVNAQSAISLKVSTFSYNFKKDIYPENLDLKFGKKGNLAFEPGLIFEYERFISDLPLSIRLIQGVGLDANNKYTGITQCKMVLSIFRQWKSAINVNVGSGIYYRQKWNIPIYSDDYSGISKNIEMSKYYFACGVEYNYSKNKNFDFSFSLNHYNKFNVHLIMGIRYWISKGSKKRYKCLTCPDYN